LRKGASGGLRAVALNNPDMSLGDTGLMEIFSVISFLS
jgi:hypothetical protein